MPCRVCHSDTLREFLDLGDQPHCDSLLLPGGLDQREPYYPLRACFCTTCTAVQIDYTVAKEEMFSEYLYVSGTTETLRAHFRESAAFLVSRLGLARGDLVVDIGSNDGTWLAAYAPYALRTLGVDPAHNLVAIAEAKGIPTLHRFFNRAVAAEIIQEHGCPKLVTAAGVFFHLEELHSVTQGIADLCREGGVFCVQAIYLGEILRMNQFDNIYHEHLTYWSVTSLDCLFAQHGLEIIEARLLPIHGGSLQLLVATQGRHSVSPTVAQFREEERQQGFGDFATYQAFAERVWQIRDRLLEILRQFKADGLTVHAFGAPAKGATLLNSFHITPELVSCAVEVNPMKVGRFIPGARIPILDEKVTPPPDAYLILAWNFLTEFLRKKKDYIMGGGKFIVPIPTPIVIDQTNYAQYTGSPVSPA